MTQALAPAMPPVPITPLVVPGLPSGLSPTNKNLPTNVITPTAMVGTEYGHGCSRLSIRKSDESPKVTAVSEDASE